MFCFCIYPWSISHSTEAMILSMLLTGEYYIPHLAPLMSHKFWTITAVTLLQPGSSDRWRGDKAILFFGRLESQNDFVFKSEIKRRWERQSVDISLMGNKDLSTKEPLNGGLLRKPMTQ